MLEIILHKFLWIFVLILSVSHKGDFIKDTSQTRVVRKMAGQDVTFPWVFPLQDSSWKILFAPNGSTMIIWRQQSTPSVFEKRASLMPDGVMLKDLSKSDDGLYRTEEQSMIVNNTMLFVYTERELRPRIFVDETLITSANPLTKHEWTIIIVAQQDLKADITLNFNNGWDTVSCIDVYMCTCGVMNLPELYIDTYDVLVRVNYGFYDTDVNFQVFVDAMDDVTNAAEMCPTWWLLYKIFVLFHILI